MKELEKSHPLMGTVCRPAYLLLLKALHFSFAGPCPRGEGMSHFFQVGGNQFWGGAPSIPGSCPRLAYESTIYHTLY